MPDLTDAETLAEVLAAHYPRPLRCRCGQVIITRALPDPGEREAVWAAHLAEALAARIAQACAGEGALRETLTRIAHSPEADRYRDEACRHVVAQPYADNRYARLLDDLRAALHGTEL